MALPTLINSQAKPPSGSLFAVHQVLPVALIGTTAGRSKTTGRYTRNKQRGKRFDSRSFPRGLIAEPSVGHRAEGDFDKSQTFRIYSGLRHYFASSEKAVKTTDQCACKTA